MSEFQIGDPVVTNYENVKNEEGEVTEVYAYSVAVKSNGRIRHHKKRRLKKLGDAAT